MTTTRILVTYGSKRGGTAELAQRIAETLRGRGFAVDCVRAAAVDEVEPYGAVIVGGALYMMRWVREARRFVARHAAALRARPVWMFSSGPLDDTASRGELPPARGVAPLIAKVGARGHATFGGRLAADATGFIASAMAKQHAGDWRDWSRVDAWAQSIAAALIAEPLAIRAPVARPARWPLAALCLLVGVPAIFGGVALVAAPDGAYVHMSVSQLVHSPFGTFLIPGLLLLLVIGAGSAFAGALVARDASAANTIAFASGAALVVWITAEMIMLRTIHPFQLLYLAIALAIMGEAQRRRLARYSRSA